MSQAGFREGNDRVAWWKVAMHLDEAQLALANAIAHNVDDPTAAIAVQERLREVQSILLEIFSAKGLLPAAANSAAHVPPPSVPPDPVDGSVGAATQVVEATVVPTDESALVSPTAIDDVPGVPPAPTEGVEDAVAAAVKAEAYEVATSAEAEVSR